MSDVYTKSIGVPRTARNGRMYGSASLTQSVIMTGITPGKPLSIIAFTLLEIPIVEDYQADYASLHGEYPSVRCIIDVDSTNGYELQQMPQFTYISGLIDTIYFVPGEAMTGKIIIQ